jgi:membrane associated rhomboid family serine protease
MRRGEIPGIAADSRPYGTITLIALSLIATVVWSTDKVSLLDMGAVYGPIGGDWWRLPAAPFLHDNAGYQFVSLLAVGIFGTVLERRFGWYVPPFIFLLTGAAGVGASVAADSYPVFGANGAALGLLTAWFVEWRMTRQTDDETDMIGATVFAAVLILLSAAWEPARIAAAAGGALAGALCGFMLAARSR